MALSEIEKLERRYAENPQGLTFAPLAEVHRKSGETQRALDLLGPGLQIHPDYIPASIVLGRCHLDLGDVLSAERAFLHVLALDGENVIALKALADISERLLKFDDAERWLHTLLTVDRSNDDAREQLQRVEIARRQAEVASSVDPTSILDPAPSQEAEAAPAPVVEPIADIAPPPPAFETPPPEPTPVRAMDFDDLEPSAMRDDAFEPPAPAESQEPLRTEEPIAPIEGLVGRETEEPDAFRIESNEDIVLESSGYSEFQMPDASQELSAFQAAGPRGPFDEEPQAPASTPTAWQSPAAEPTADMELVDGKAAETEPSREVEPVGEVEQPAAEPTFMEPATSEPSFSEPAAYTEPAYIEPPHSEPSYSEPSYSEPAYSEPAYSEPAYTEPAYSEPAYSEPAAPEPLMAEPPIPEPANTDQSEPEPPYRPYEPEPSLAESPAVEPFREPSVAAAEPALSEPEPEPTAAASPASMAPPVTAAPKRAYGVDATGGRSVAQLFKGILDARPPAQAPAAQVRHSAPSGAGAPTRPAADALSLSSVFGEEGSDTPPAVPAPTSAGGAVSFDDFFGSSSATPASRAPRAPDSKNDDLDQFHAWLQNLKR